MYSQPLHNKIMGVYYLNRSAKPIVIASLFAVLDQCLKRLRPRHHPYCVSIPLLDPLRDTLALLPLAAFYVITLHLTTQFFSRHRPR